LRHRGGNPSKALTPCGREKEERGDKRRGKRRETEKSQSVLSQSWKRLGQGVNEEEKLHEARRKGEVIQDRHLERQ